MRPYLKGLLAGAVIGAITTAVSGNFVVGLVGTAAGLVVYTGIALLEMRGR